VVMRNNDYFYLISTVNSSQIVHFSYNKIFDLILSLSLARSHTHIIGALYLNMYSG